MTIATPRVHFGPLTFLNLCPPKKQFNMKFHKVAHYFHVTKLSHNLDKTKFMLFYSNIVVKNLNADLFINNNSPNVDVENPNLLHKMKQIDSSSKSQQ
jgi:hypothetical protein